MQDIDSDLDWHQHLDPGLVLGVLCHCEIGQKSLLAGLQKKLQVDLIKIFREGLTCPNLDVIRFCW